MGIVGNKRSAYVYYSAHRKLTILAFRAALDQRYADRGPLLQTYKNAFQFLRRRLQKGLQRALQVQTQLRIRLAL